MMQTLKLKNPVLINGNKVKELTYDTNEITSLNMAEAYSMYRSSLGKNVAISPAAEFDFGLYVYYGMAAIIAVNSGISYSDLERIKGHDGVEVMKIGRNFILGAEEQPQSNSDEQSGSTADDTTQA